MWIEEKLSEFGKNISKSEKAGFAAAWIGGLIAHLYIYTNIIPNFDGISRVYEEQQMTVSGRWFLHYVSYLHSFTQMPMVIGVLAMFFLAVSIALTIQMFQIHSSLFAGIYGLLAAVFPAIAYTNAYTFTVSAYCFAILLAAAGVWVTGKWKWGFWPAGILLALSMGTYQVYATVAITLSLLLVLQQTLSEDTKTKNIVQRGFRYIAYLSWGAILYYLILQVFLKAKNLQLLSYLGMDEVQQGYPIKEIGSILAKTYQQTAEFFFQIGSENGFSSLITVIVHSFLVLLIVCLFILVIWQEKVWTNKVKLIGSIVLLVLMPLAVNFGQVISPYSVPTPIMKYAFVLWYFVPLLLLDRLFYRKNSIRTEDLGQENKILKPKIASKIRKDKSNLEKSQEIIESEKEKTKEEMKEKEIKIEEAKEKMKIKEIKIEKIRIKEEIKKQEVKKQEVKKQDIKKQKGKKINWFCEGAAVLTVSSIFILLVYFWEYNNILYTMLNQAHRTTLSFVTNVVSRIESCNGYQYGMKVVIVGGFPSDRYKADIENYNLVEQGGALSSSVIPMNKHIYYYMQDWLNVPIEEPEEEDFYRISQSAEFIKMPLYPNDGSVQVIDDCIVVKMQETFTPKAAYEKAYEQRR